MASFLLTRTTTITTTTTIATRIRRRRRRRRRSSSASTFLALPLLLVLLSSSSQALLGLASGISSAQAATELEISYVIEPFEADNITTIGPGWFLDTTTTSSTSNDDDDAWDFRVDIDHQGKTSNDDDALFGNGSLRVEFRHRALPLSASNNNDAKFDDDRGSLTFGWDATTSGGGRGGGGGPPHNCYGATYLSLWYKILPNNSTSSSASSSSSSSSPPPEARVSTIKLSLVDDKNNTFSFDAGAILAPTINLNSAEEVSEQGATEWQEIRIYPLPTESDLLNLRQIQKWQVELVVEAAVVNDSEEEEEQASTQPGIVLFDQLACVGGGDMLGNAFRPGSSSSSSNGEEETMTWEQAIQMGMWGELYYLSDLSQNQSTVQFTTTDHDRAEEEDHHDVSSSLFLNYTIEQTEAWGGFLSVEFLAPANAYYNLSSATRLEFGYTIHESSSQPGRAHLRLILSESSNTVACSSSSSELLCGSGEDNERWYSFNYILDDDDDDAVSSKKTTTEIVLPLEGSTEAGLAFWLTGWSGSVGDRRFNKEYIKGYLLELSMDSQGDVGSLVRGALEFGNLRALGPPADNDDNNDATENGDHTDHDADSFELSYVMEPFEWMDDDWFVLDHHNNNNNNNDGGTLNLTVTSTDALFGNFSLRVDYRFHNKNGGGDGSDETTVALASSFGVIRHNLPHNCWGATHVSVWYRFNATTTTTTTTTGVTDLPQLRLGLFDDDGNIHETTTKIDQMEFYTIDFPPPAESDVVGEEEEDQNDGIWHEVRVPIEEFQLDDNNHAAGVAGGNGVLDLNRLRGWSIAITGSEPSSGSIFVDQLACIGGEELIGAPFFTGLASFDEAVEEDTWSTEFYLSEVSENQSQLVLDNSTSGTLSINYTVQQVEAWGGFLSAGYYAPGPAYYNLSQANYLNLRYDIQQPASVPGRVHVRLILQDSSDVSCFNCTDWERWYNFNYILDDDDDDDNPTTGGSAAIRVPLEGSTDPASPFWLPGWAGGLGNSRFDKDRIKGVSIEFSLDSQGDLGSTVSGAIDLYDMTATPTKDSPSSSSVVEEENLLSGENDDNNVCIEEFDLSFGLSAFRRREFLGNRCPETCLSDPECLYALSSGQDCYTASTLDPRDVFIANTVVLQRDYSAYWVDGSRRGDYCSLCECRELDRTLDCRNRDLRTLPKTLAPLPWKPRVLDLRNNSKLVLLGTGALDELSDSLEELWLPRDMVYLSPAINQLKTLSKVHWEDDGPKLLSSNAIAASTEAFSDICCSQGTQMNLSYPESGLTFCKMEVKRPGSDSTYLPFVNFFNGPSISIIRPSSEFMSEAAESAEKCAEYCSISSNCKFFSYDARVKNAEHVCYLRSSNGTQHLTVCCEDDHYADEAQTLPGWTSGLPPRTRNEIHNARVLIGPHNLVADATNGYQTQYDVHLGSTPIRGAVWIEPSISSSTVLDVSFEPPRVVLYDANATVSIKVSVSVAGVDPGTNVPTLIIHNQITSCDEAFMEQTNNLVVADSENTVFIDVVVPEEDIDSNNIVVIVTSVLCFAIVVVISLSLLAYFDAKRRATDGMWKIKREELIFDDPPVIVGRGSYGLVLKAEFRGTAVAVKRVIPPKRKYQGSGTLSSSGHKFDVERTANHSDDMNDSMPLRSTPSGEGMTSLRMDLRSRSQSTDGFWSLAPRSSDRAAWRKRKEGFIAEMSHLAKLRHPCITTAMGAVIGGKSEPMLVMELMHHGSLYDLLHNETMILDAEIILPILRNISQGMRFLHSSDPTVIHGDLKSQNILVDRNFRAKVADFGLSDRKDGVATGTPYWMAPELIRSESGNTTASDIYSFGIIIWEIFSRKEPYYGENMTDVLRLVADETVNKRPEIPRDMPAAVQSYMTDCLVGNPEHRPTFTELDQRLHRIDESMLEMKNDMRSSRRGQNSNISLFDIFPRHVAEALKQGRKPEPEHRDVVTIFFSDIVGFTDISSRLEPQKIAAMLDRLYSVFDALSDQHDIYKVETIGDAYMAVSNLVKDQPDDHVKRITEFALDAIEAAKTVAIDSDKPELGCVEIRVGFHSGPVVADVVGTRNPRFCLFGDAVNTASRMESNGEKGRIHCSSASAEILETQFPEMPLASRGEIDVKGKGKMTTYWVNENGQRPSETSLERFSRSVHSVNYYARSFRFSKNTTTAGTEILADDEEERYTDELDEEEKTAGNSLSLAETGQSQRTTGFTTTGSSSSTTLEVVGVEQATSRTTTATTTTSVDV